ncbi:hypothetical protein E0485_14550 [Paenibacillus albiflavus]|uniref:Uncharacterized protein n=1 Tax=Paenibacillus albiflavus TaxID=2545760 RepID=A0A4R4EAF0_9BACL|nr:hypothetical protein [Paenibacillus albiflavus]TCZ76063.1 hypothetical protein E0485_14550 [Paenibacillus albiflavus]
MKIKQVVFNVEDPHQSRLLEHALCQKNFSAYIKRLIDHDLMTDHPPVNLSNEPLKLDTPTPPLILFHQAKTRSITTSKAGTALQSSKFIAEGGQYNA